MAKDFNMPNFNLGDDPEKPEIPQEPMDFMPEEQPKAKPKITFEDSLDDNISDNVPVMEPKKKESQKKDAEKKDSGKKEAPPKESKPDKPKSEHKGGSKKIWLFLLLALLVIIAGGTFFLHSQGYLDVNKIFSQVGELKESIFGKKAVDSTALAEMDSLKAVIAAQPSADSSVSKVPSNENNQTTEPGKIEEVKKDAETKTETPKSAEPAKVEPHKETLKPIEKPKTKEINVKANKEPVKTIKAPVKETKKPAAKETVKKIENPTVANGKFLIQISAVRTTVQAEREVNRLKKMGIKAQIQTVTLQDRGMWHRVVIGPYATKKDAEMRLPSLNRQLGVRGIIREK